MLHRRTVTFQVEGNAVALDLREAQEFQYRLSQAPGGHPLEHQIQLAIENQTPVIVAENHKAAAVSVLMAWFDEVGEVSPEAGELLATLRKGE